jgi:hypothetical protein
VSEVSDGDVTRPTAVGPWPTATDYVAAVQAPAATFHHDGIAELRPRPGLMGLPAATTGQNAIVFDTDGPRGRTALRCFTSVPARGDDAYRRLEAMDLPDVLVPVRWHADAIEISGARWPVVTMPWIVGDPLNRWVGDNIHRPARVAELADAWVEACRIMPACGIAHGDLQHGNVLVTPDAQLRLIDFDGVLLFDPATGSHLTGPPTEVGHPNYQHPQRIEEGHVSRYVDTFSALLIHTSLRALVNDPGLWSAHRGENLVLSQRDLFEPESSDVFARLRASDDPLVARSADLLARWCRSGVRANLTLADVLGPGASGAAVVVPSTGYRSRAAEREVIAHATDPTADWTEASRPEAVDDPSEHAQYRAAGIAPDGPAAPLSLPSEPGVRTPGMVDQVRERFLRTVVIPVVLGVMVASLLLVLVGSTGLVSRLMPGQEQPLPALLEVGSCFVVDESGRVLPERCSARNDGDVLAEVVDPEACEGLADATSVPFAVVEGRTFCLADRVDDR